MSIYGGPCQDWTRGFSSGLHRFNTPEELSRGKLKLFDFPQTQLDLENIPWSGVGSQAISHPSWLMWLHSLKWLDQLVGIEDTGGSNPSGFRLAGKIARQWVEWNSNVEKPVEAAWDGHATGLRLTTLVAISSVMDQEEWLRDAIEHHVGYLRSPEHFDGHWNHGLVQSLALLGAALRIDDRESSLVAQDRIMETIDVMVDDEGAINEQATAYSNYIHNLLTTVIGIWQSNNIDGAKRLIEKREDLKRFILHSIEPNGCFVQLGDSSRKAPDSFANPYLEYAVSQGARGEKPQESSAIFRQGYVFGRSGWGEHRPVSQESFYSLRFGPGRIIHGHNDHTSLTWYEMGRNIIVDSGHSGYSPGAMRDYLRSPTAHNVTLLPGERYDWAAATELTTHAIDDRWSFYELSDEPHKGLCRVRGALVIDKGPMVVLDRTFGTRKALHRQLWHLSPEFSLRSLGSHDVRFRSALGDMELAIIRFNIEDNDIQGLTGVTFWEGEKDPMQGWVARRDGEETPAPVIGFDVRTESLSLLTALVAVPVGSSLGWSYRRSGAEESILRIHVGATSYAVDVHVRSGRMTLRSIS